MFAKGVPNEYENDDRPAEFCKSRRAARLRSASYPLCGDGFGEVREPCFALARNLDGQCDVLCHANVLIRQVQSG